MQFRRMFTVSASALALSVSSQAFAQQGEDASGDVPGDAIVVTGIRIGNSTA